MTKELKLVQILRAIAASMVVFNHFNLGYSNSNQYSFFVSSGLGHIEGGVDLFFVISGFIMFYTQCPNPETEKGSLKIAFHFLKKRILRIMPLYWFWTTVLLILWILKIAFKDQSFDLHYLFCSYFLIPCLSKHAGFRPLLEQGWSLAFEMYFYLLFAIVLIFRRCLSNTLYIALLFAINYLISLYLHIPALTYLVAYPMNIEFIFGASIAWIVMKWKFDFNRNLLWVIFYLGCTLMFSRLFINMNRIIVYGIPSTIIMFAAVLLDKNRHETSISTFLLFLGNASYSIYLTHSYFALAFGMSAKAGKLNHFNGDLLIILGTIATILFCSLAYLFFEMPLMHLLRKETLQTTKV